jgi:hypothetical protein
MQGIENCTPETNHVSRVRSIAAIPYSQFVMMMMIIIIIIIIYNYILTSYNISLNGRLYGCKFFFTAEGIS